jgi:hypothetical protein
LIRDVLKGDAGSTSFCEQKAAKNFDFLDVALPVAPRPEGDQKFFGSFFQERTSYFL